MIVPEYSARDLLAANVAALMATPQHADKSSAKKLAEKCFWPATSGPKRRGKPLSERYIRYVLKPTPDAAHSPSIDVITAIAEAFGVQAWELLADARVLRLWELGKLFTMSEGITDQQVEKHLPFPPSEKTEPEGKRKRGSNPGAGDD